MNDLKKFCKNCGAPLTPDGKFCEGCGQHIDGRSDTAAMAPLSDPLPQTSSPPQIARSQATQPGSKGALPWIIAVVILITLGGLAGGYFWGKSKEGSPLPSPPAASTPAPPKTEPQPVAEKSPVPAPPETAKGEAAGLTALPPPPPVDQQVGTASLPPPPPLDQKEETALPFLPPIPDQKAASTPLPEPPPVATPELPAVSGGSTTWPWTSERPVTTEDMSQLSHWELVLMRNEIYARHGWIFRRADLQAHFDKQPWYRPRGTSANREAVNRQVSAELTPLERQNVRTILQYEQSRRGMN